MFDIISLLLLMWHIIHLHNYTSIRRCEPSLQFYALNFRHLTSLYIIASTIMLCAHVKTVCHIYMSCRKASIIIFSGQRFITNLICIGIFILTAFKHLVIGDLKQRVTWYTTLDNYKKVAATVLNTLYDSTLTNRLIYQRYKTDQDTFYTIL